ncbi:MAG: hypothetical protein A2017_03655 [Lentisphaerae bacterium GWF2_44_16]|nr:MAG: hypothetical protein A2017_03655 [Lentisphaerae bacterium GWF2_44_16]
MKLTGFFDVNGFIGKGFAGESEYPDIEKLLEKMNYLGIERSIAWSIEARDNNPYTGNKKLIELLASKKEYKDRIIPAFVITPSMVFEKGVVKDTLAYLKKHNAVLRIFPATSRFSMICIERVLTELKSANPIVLWSYRDAGNRELDSLQFVELAKKFPKTKFIVTEVMWGQFTTLLDMMWRAPNIMLDISWLHMRDAIKILCGHFGAERVVFGTGYKSHYGAAIAGLNFAEITDGEKELIAHGNMEKCLGLKPLRKCCVREPELLSKKDLWKTLLDGKAIERVDIIDAHAHSGASTRGWTFEDRGLEDVEAMRKSSKRLGIKRVFISHHPALFCDPVEGNLEIENALKGDDMYSGYFVFNPNYHEKLKAPLLNEFFSRDFFKGFKLLPSYWKVPVTDARYKGAWEYAGKYKLPILIHTWDDKYNSPAMLKGVVKKYPGASFLLGHSGGGTGGRKEAVELALNNKNVYLEFCGSFTTPADWVDTFREVGPKKVIFGTDGSAHDQAWELGRFLSIPVPDEKLTPALSSNFARILSKARKPRR